MCPVSLPYGPLLTNTVLLIVIFPWVAATKHGSKAMLSFAAADPFLPTHVILFANDEMWKKPACVVVLLKKGRSCLHSNNKWWTEVDTAERREIPDLYVKGNTKQAASFGVS